MKFKKPIIITLFLLSFLMIGFVSASSDNNVVNSDLTMNSNHNDNDGFVKTSHTTLKQCNDKSDVCLKYSASKNIVSKNNDNTKSDDDEDYEDEDYDEYDDDEDYEDEDYDEYDDDEDYEDEDYEDEDYEDEDYEDEDYDEYDDDEDYEDEDYDEYDDDEDYDEYEEGMDVPLYESYGVDVQLASSDAYLKNQIQTKRDSKPKNHNKTHNKETIKHKHNSNGKYLTKNKNVIKKSLYKTPNKTFTKNTSNSQSNNKPTQDDTTTIQNNNQQDYFQILTNQYEKIKELCKSLQNLFFRLLFSFKELII